MKHFDNMAIRALCVAGFLVSTIWSGVAGEPYRLTDGTPDELATRYITPKRVLWVSDDTGTPVKNHETLLRPFGGQVSVNGGAVCTLSTLDGGAAAILLDFGREYQGGIEIAASMRADKRPLRVRVRLGESATEAMSDTDNSNDSVATGKNPTATNDHAMRDFTLEVPWLGTVRVGELGFRFVRIDLVDSGAVLDLVAVRGVVRFRDIPWAGSFESNRERLDEIWRTGGYTVHLNMQNHLWDGIKRDRLVWVGDLHPEVMCVNSIFGPSGHDVVRRSLDFARDDTPLPGWMNGMCSYSLWWIVCQRDLYMYCGDGSYLAAQHDYLTALVDQILANLDGGRENLAGGTRFLDWPTSEMPDVIHAGLQALTVMSLRAASELGGWLGDERLSRKCDAAVKKLLRHHPDHKGNKQAAAMLALAGLLGADNAAAIIEEGGPQGFSTFYGYYMLEALALAGKWDAAMDIISKYWGAMLDLGATTFWEELDWAEVPGAARIDELVPPGLRDLHGEGGAWCYEGFRRSLCHGWASGPTSWLTRHVLGVRPLEPGFRKVAVEPHLGRLSRVKGTVPTPHGVITVLHTRRADGTVVTSVDAPEGVEVVM